MANDNKKGLGRGLSSLIGGYEASFKSDTSNVSRETNEKVPSTPLHSAQDDSESVSRETVEQERSFDSTHSAQDDSSLSRVKERSDEIEGTSPFNEEGPSTSLRSAQDDVEVVSRETSSVVSEQAINAEEAEPEVIIREVEEEEAETEEEEVEVEEGSNLTEIDVNDIEPNPDQPRMNFDEQKLQELAHSIQDQGLLQPIVVREKEGKYQIIAGERRWQASRIAGLETIPCIVQEVDDNKALELALIENIQRDDLNPIEEAYTYKRLMDKMNYTQAELAKAVAKGRSTIANAIRLLDLPEDAQKAMYERKLTAGHARAILSVPSAKGRKKLTDKIISEKMNVREAESLARLLSIDTSSNVRTNTNNIPAAYTAMAKSLKEVLKTQVKVKKTKTGSKLEIAFKNEEELRAIYDKLVEE